MALSLLVALVAVQEKPAPEAPDKYKITVTATGVPSDPKTGKKSAILVEGSTNLPAGVRLSIFVYYGIVVDRHLATKDFLLPGDGKFSEEVPVFAGENLCGHYIVQVVFYAALQAPVLVQNLGADARTYAGEARFQIADDEAMRRDRQKVIDRLTLQIRKITAMVEEVEAEHRKSLGKPFDAAAWSRLVAVWTKRSLAVEKETYGNREAMALGLDGLTDAGLEALYNMLIGLANATGVMIQRPGDQDLAAVLTQRRVTLLNQAQKYIDGMQPRPGREEVIVMAQEARDLLKAALELSGERLTESRKRFILGMGRLDRVMPGTFHEAILKIAVAQIDYFQALTEGKKGDAAKHFVALDLQFDALLKSLKGN